MAEFSIYHNPRCRKSRETLQLLQEKGIEPKIVEYLKEIPSASDMKQILKKLGIPAEKLVRKEEAVFKTNYKGKDLSESEWIDVMIENPKLIQRPIVLKGNKAVLGRPPENVLELM